MVSPENIHTSNIIQTEQVIFRNIYVYTCTYIYTEAYHAYMHAITINEKEGHEFLKTARSNM